MPPLPSAILTCVFLLCGVGATTVMMIRLGRLENQPGSRLLYLHWIFGWGFTAAFLVMLTTMFGRFYAYWEEDPARIVFHYTAAFALLVLLTIKIAVPRLFPRLRSHLFLLGSGVFLLAFLTAASALSHYLVRITQRAPYISHSDISTDPDLDLGKELFIQRCRTCHIIDTILRQRPAREWEKVVNAMSKLAWPRIRPDEAKQILHYLTETRVPREKPVGTGVAVLDMHCLPCHKPDEIFAKTRDRKGWEVVVKEMSGISPENVPAAQFGPIVDALVEEQAK